MGEQEADLESHLQEVPQYHIAIHEVGGNNAGAAVRDSISAEKC